jgi:2-C-methyl-D-erythritol 4-phosphate cytidylyltransferase/2-C-methyl-D-erythritol 2,4-cyclodiphosphate synthase
MFIGTGWDIHKHSNSRPLTLGGVVFDEEGFEAHSDGDILLHALIDAILGATGNKDIGHYFPSNEKTPDDMASFDMLREILEEIDFSRFVINDIDMTIISQKINISTKREVIEDNISKLLSLDENKINLKGKSTDKLGIIGKNEASAALVSISLSNA